MISWGWQGFLIGIFAFRSKANGACASSIPTPTFTQELDMPLPDPLITISSGEPTFTGTRVPVRTFFEYIEVGGTLETFLDEYRAVTREHVSAALKASLDAVRVIFREIERETYHASAEELAAIDEALGQVARGEHASNDEVEAAFARFRR
jgi:uncharacterized protein (DUF433 family)